MFLDLRLEGGRILTMDRDRPVASAVGVWRGWIVGLDEEISDLPARRVVDLGGATLLPGFVDAHTHLAWSGLSARTVDISGCTSTAQVLETVRRAAANTPPDGWVEISGYDHRQLDRTLTAADLDHVSGGRPVFVQDRSGHACVVNSVVLDQLPARLRTAGTPGVHCDADGRPTGGLAEGAHSTARALRLPYSIGEIAEGVAHSARQCLTEGVTFCAEAGVGGGFIGHSPVEVAAYQQVRAEGRLPIRTQLMVSSDVLHPVAAHPSDGLARTLDLGLRTGLGDARLSIGALKVFLDGGMMTRTAALTEPYVGREGRGQLQDDPEALRQVIVDGHAAGWQMAIHAIGDRAIDLALDAVETAQRLVPRTDARHRIEHCGLVRPDQLTRLAEAGVTAVVQPSFLWSYGDDYAAVMGPERADWMYRGRAFLEHGIAVAGSSDRPVATGAPLRAIQFMVERASSGGQTLGASESVTVEQALSAYTTGGARACRSEALLGSVTPGKLADFVLLGDDPRRTEVSRIAEIDVLATVVGGEFVHQSAAFSDK